jgi:hypothetical protein
LPLRGLESPLPSLVLGGSVLAVAYLLLTFVFGCWSRGDIEHMQGLHRRVPALRALTAWLVWADKRACKDA